MSDGPVQVEAEVHPVSEFEDFVLSAATDIKDGKYLEAIDKLGNPELPSRYGIFYSKNNAPTLVISKPVAQADVQSLADSVANASSFTEHQKQVKTVGIFTVPEVERSAELEHDVALVNVEEWLHALQFLKGGNLTKEAGHHEHDVAIYLAQHGVPLTASFTARYGRGEALAQWEQAGKPGLIPEPAPQPK